MAKKPILGKNHPDDEILLKETTETIGDYRLKESADYKPKLELRDTTLKKYYELLNARLKVRNKITSLYIPKFFYFSNSV